MSTPDDDFAEEQQRTSPAGGSDSSSDNSYVQVSREDAAQETLLSDEHPEFGMEAQEEKEEEEEEEDIYGEPEKDEELSEMVQVRTRRLTCARDGCPESCPQTVTLTTSTHPQTHRLA